MKLRRMGKSLAVAGLLAGVGLSPQYFSIAGAEPSQKAPDGNATEKVITGEKGAKVKLKGPGGCNGASMDTDSGQVDDPTPDLMSTVVVEVDEKCKRPHH